MSAVMMTATAFNNLPRHCRIESQDRRWLRQLGPQPCLVGSDLASSEVTFVEPLKSAIGYLSVRRNDQGRRCWTVMAQGGVPLCADTHRPGAIAVASQVYGRLWLSLWDGDRGEFVTDLCLAESWVLENCTQDEWTTFDGTFEQAARKVYMERQYQEDWRIWEAGPKGANMHPIRVVMDIASVVPGSMPITRDPSKETIVLRLPDGVNKEEQSFFVIADALTDDQIDTMADRFVHDMDDLYRDYKGQLETFREFLAFTLGKSAVYFVGINNDRFTLFGERVFHYAREL